MNEFVVYILKSKSRPDKIYIGYTSDLLNRVKSHNIFATKGHTIKFRPWDVAMIWFFDSKLDAMKHEKYLKSGVGRKFIHTELVF